MVPALAMGLCALFTPEPLNAQSGNAAQKFQPLATQVALTPAQKNQFIPILVAEAPKVKAIKADLSRRPIQKAQQLKAVHERTDPQLRAVLSPQQYHELQTFVIGGWQLIEQKRNR
jgi:hypothetical protein